MRTRVKAILKIMEEKFGTRVAWMNWRSASKCDIIMMFFNVWIIGVCTKEGLYKSKKDRSGMSAIKNCVGDTAEEVNRRKCYRCLDLVACFSDFGFSKGTANSIFNIGGSSLERHRKGMYHRGGSHHRKNEEWHRGIVSPK